MYIFVHRVTTVGIDYCPGVIHQYGLSVLHFFLDDPRQTRRLIRPQVTNCVPASAPTVFLLKTPASLEELQHH